MKESGTSLRSIILFLAVIGLPPLLHAQPTTGLVAHWPFSGNANDVSGNDHNGTFLSAPALTKDRFGNPNRSYTFDGVDDGIRIANHTRLNLPQSFSISGWFRSCVPHSGYLNLNVLVAQAASNSNGGPWGLLEYEGFSLTFNNYWGLSSSGSLQGTPIDRSFGRASMALRCGPDSLVVNNNWHHVVYVVDKANGADAIYVDNTLFRY